MSQFYDQASLVMVPSGYKNGKVYSQKPLSTDGELTFTRASTATRVNASGLIESVASGIPRLDYTPTLGQSGGGGASCPSLLLEPQRSNICTYSEQINQWLQERTSVTANAITSPSGYVDADKVITDSTPDNTHQAYNGPFTNTAGNVAFSGFFKKGEYDYVHFGAGSSNSKTWFNLNTGAVGTQSSDVVSASIEAYSNGWYRCVAIVNLATTSNYVEFGPASVDGSRVISGTPSGGIYGWGIQMEDASSYATSYIPTLSSAVTRVEETAIKTGASAIIGQTEGTIFVEFKRVPKGVNYQTVFSLQGASSAQLIEAYFNNADTLIVGVYNSGAQYQTLTSALTEGTYKIAVAYKENDFAFYVNGVQISTDNNGTVPALSTFNLGGFTYVAGYPLSDGIKQALLFKTRLSNADLATLTAL